MGVAEHVFDVDIHGKTVTWHLYDVGGARGQRNAWIPYFDSANATIFLAPISAFDQVRSSFRVFVPCSKGNMLCALHCVPLQLPFFSRSHSKLLDV